MQTQHSHNNRWKQYKKRERTESACRPLQKRQCPRKDKPTREPARECSKRKCRRRDEQVAYTCQHVAHDKVRANDFVQRERRLEENRLLSGRGNGVVCGEIADTD